MTYRKSCGVFTALFFVVFALIFYFQLSDSPGPLRESWGSHSFGVVGINTFLLWAECGVMAGVPAVLFGLLAGILFAEKNRNLEPLVSFEQADSRIAAIKSQPGWRKAQRKLLALKVLYYVGTPVIGAAIVAGAFFVYVIYHHSPKHSEASARQIDRPLELPSDRPAVHSEVAQVGIGPADAELAEPETRALPTATQVGIAVQDGAEAQARRFFMSVSMDGGDGCRVVRTSSERMVALHRPEVSVGTAPVTTAEHLNGIAERMHFYLRCDAYRVANLIDEQPKGEKARSLSDIEFSEWMDCADGWSVLSECSMFIPVETNSGLAVQIVRLDGEAEWRLELPLVETQDWPRLSSLTQGAVGTNEPAAQGQLAEKSNNGPRQEKGSTDSVARAGGEKGGKASSSVSGADGTRIVLDDGLEIRTARPKFTTLEAIGQPPKNPLVSVWFGEDGVVVRARIDESSGYEQLDGPILDSIYRWRASGERLRALKPGKAAKVQLRIKL